MFVDLNIYFIRDIYVLEKIFLLRFILHSVQHTSRSSLLDIIDYSVLQVSHVKQLGTSATRNSYLFIMPNDGISPSCSSNAHHKFFYQYHRNIQERKKFDR